MQMSLRPVLSLLLCVCMMQTASSFRHFLVPAQPGHEVREGSCNQPPPFVSIPVPKRHVGHSPASGTRLTKAIRGVEALAQTISAVKQEIARRDVFLHIAKKRAYADEPAAAADKCPNLKEISKKSRPSDFTEDLYQGIWYELAYHDVTQANYFCGCTRFNFTIRSNNMIEDMFTTTCPMTGVLPGEDVAKKIYTLNMTIQYDKSKPGEFLEKGFAYNFPNYVLYVWKKTANGKTYYDRSLQMQCVEAAGKILFVGINFLARGPKVSKAELDEMFDKAKELGIDRYGGDRAGMYMVKHDGCEYPVSTDASVMGPRSDFPGPLMDKVCL
ncbi:hypothetical protein GUITHDRAFT_133874 [Guillardia theta CCMP2712]|uniref:Lipocalin/cytosolic fatty-acid binding domain-containing protein n=1 Tax=Guillardia theta (strain CCMP2712) TaxID=905079 RepID=L1JVM0_GUITC|nr:hypothetical protein GUITHDRAFT_133874 [Guillardia theta CCMP2712]EKX52148.1 hypothetical protein GUITHDRAFT_133874 [Guillardia theta CCMP2712]|eukprot:XP_005839128.1 hypothetical protein GUITHDRAFT_133874 [Guillardia theta CCMP2712]